MKLKSILLTTVTLGSLLTANARWIEAETRDYNPDARERLIAHEWGTKLNVQGSDGAVHEGLYFKKELAVPDFVYQFSDTPPLTTRQKGIIIKPVLYFYSEEPVEVKVEAICNNGTWLEWYPRAVYEDLLDWAERVEKNEKIQDQLEIQADTAQDAHLWALNRYKPVTARKLLWWGELIPPGHAEYQSFFAQLDQNIPADGWYPITRNTDSAIFRARFEYPWANEVEKFLFYRGSANTPPNIKVNFKNEATTFSVEPTSQNSDSRPLFFIENTPEKNMIILLAQSDSPFNTDIHIHEEKSLNSAEAKAELSRIGQTAGLYAKEADGMAEIWSKDYFERPGRRLIYQIGPTELANEQTLKITPTPKELIRFQIGWLELPTDQSISEIKALVEEFQKDDSVLPAIKSQGFIAHPFMWELYHQTENESLKTLIYEYFTSPENGI